MIDYQEKIITTLRLKGPCLPSDLYKQLETNQLFASAMLGELSSNGKIKITSLKRGSSPYYYLEEHKEQLQNLSNFLNDKDKLAYDLLREKLILNDSEQTPLMRVALRSIKDYAIPLQINYQDQRYLFWKWYLLSNKDAEERIKQILGIVKQEPKKEEVIEKKIEPIQEIKKEEPKPIIKKESKPEAKAKTLTEAAAPFLDQITRYFKKNEVNVISHEFLNNKRTEIDFIIELPSAVGKLQYYCKAKNKKKINDADIASAFVQGQQKKLPILFLITGEMTKRSHEMLDKEFKGIKVNKI